MDIVKYLMFRDFLLPLIITVGFMLVIGIIAICEVIEEKIEKRLKKKKDVKDKR